MARRNASATGTVDGGEGRGIRLGGSDRRPPTGYRSIEPFDDDEVLINDDSLSAYDDFADESDAQSEDRRRDPLRR